MALTYYVTTTGNDGNTGLSPINAFLTPQHASDVSTAGDTVLIRTGSYPGFSVSNTGTPGHVITFANYNGEAVTIDASLGTVSGGIFGNVSISVRSKSYITLSGLRVTGADASAEFEIFGSDHIQILGCEASYAESTGIGVYAACHDVLVENCSIFENSQVNFPRGSVVGDWGAGIISAYGNHEITFKDCYIYRNHGEGCTFGAHTYNSTMDGLVIQGNWSVNLYLESSQNLTVKNCIVWVTEQDTADGLPHSNPVNVGLTTGDNSGGFTGPDTWLTNLHFYNNIVQAGDWGMQRYSSGSPSPDNGWIIANNLFVLFDSPGVKYGTGASSLASLLFQNNIFVNALGASFPDWGYVNFTLAPSSATISNNSYRTTTTAKWLQTGTSYSSGASWTAASGDSSLLTSDPQLFNTNTRLPNLWGPDAVSGSTIKPLASLWYHPNVGSPSLASGATVAIVTTDAEGVPRVAPYSRAAFEDAQDSISLDVTAIVDTWTVPAVTLTKSQIQLNPPVVTASWAPQPVTFTTPSAPLPISAVSASWSIPDVDLNPNALDLSTVTDAWAVSGLAFEVSSLNLDVTDVVASWTVPSLSLSPSAISLAPGVVTAAWNVSDLRINPATPGDIIYRGPSEWLRLPGSLSATQKFLAQTGTGTSSAAPEWVDSPITSGYWSNLTNGDPMNPEIIFDGTGNVIMCFVPTP